MGADYFVYVLGRNGEPEANLSVTVSAWHKDFSTEAQSITQTTDKQGRVGLGQLKDICRISANCRVNSDYLSENWMIVNQEKDSWTQHTDIHIVEGETVEFPVNFDDSKPLLEREVSLAMYRDGNVLQNLFKRIQLTKHSHYHMLSLVGLEVGEYTLITKFCANEFQNISITVHKG